MTTPAERSAAACGWFQRHRPELPTAPFVLSQGCTVANSDRFYAALAAAISQWDGSGDRVWVCSILFPIRKLKTYLESVK